jgi:putative acetyltransferase
VPLVHGNAFYEDSMIIRRYQLSEEVALWNVYYRATHESNSRDYHADLLNRWAPHDKDMNEWRERLLRTNPFVAIIDDQIVGMAEINADGFIGNFYVLPEFQGQGIGTQLLARIESEAQDMSIVALNADVSVTAKEFFEARGFRVLEARSNIIIDHPAPNFAMRKNLARG